MLWTCRLWGGVIIGSYKRRGMDDPTKATVELTKEEKLKQLNDRLNNMLKLKKVDPLTLHHPITHPPHH